MALKLFEMEATLSLDTSGFSDGVTNAINKGNEIQGVMNGISSDQAESEIAKLDSEIDKLDKAIEDYDKEISSLENDISTMDKKSSIIQGIYQGVAVAGKELLSKSLEYLFDFAVDSLEYVENSGTKVGNAYAQAKAEMTAAANVIKSKLGTEIAVVSTGLMNVASQVLGITQEDKLRSMFSQLQSYKFQNLENVNTTLEAIFTKFEKVDLSSLGGSESVSEMNEGLQSQIDYWNEYDRVIQALKDRGVSDEMLATYADGSKESLSRLLAFESSSGEELEQMQTLFAELETARKGVATEISNAQLEVDASVDNIVSSITQLAQDIEGVDSSAAAAKMAKGIVSSLSAEYPSISNWTNRIISKLSQLEKMYKVTDILTTPMVTYDEPIGPTPQYEDLPSVGKGFATGLDYVPYDEYPALLHEGEAVLTKAEAEEWRKSPMPAGYEIDYDRLAAAVAVALSGVSVNMDGVAVGRLTAPTVSREIYTATNARRYG